MTAIRSRWRCGASVGERMAVTARKNPACGGPPGSLGCVAALARCPTSRGAPLLPQGPGWPIKRFNLVGMCSNARRLKIIREIVVERIEPPGAPSAISPRNAAIRRPRARRSPRRRRHGSGPGIIHCGRHERVGKHSIPSHSHREWHGRTSPHARTNPPTAPMTGVTLKAETASLAYRPGNTILGNAFSIRGAPAFVTSLVALFAARLTAVSLPA